MDDLPQTIISWLGYILPPTAGAGALLMYVFRPKLVLRIDQPFCRQKVFMAGAQIPAIALRLYVENRGFLTTEVTGQVEEITLNERPLDSEKAQLNSWMDSNKDKETLERGEHKYINLCLVQEDKPKDLFIYSVRGSARQFQSNQRGYYRLKVVVKGTGLHSSYELTVEVRHNVMDDDPSFMPTPQGKSKLRFGRFSFSRLRQPRM